MIKVFLHKTFSATLACLVLFSTLSFTVEKHYCGENLIDVAIFTKANNCGMDMETVAANYKEKKHCCKDEVEVLKGQDQLKKTSFEDLEFDQQIFLSTFAYSYLNLFEGLPELVIPHKDYSPPILIVDIQVLDQVFII
ncbi:HYC_CC_PP family protein [Xanthomarina sp. F2636L]|uniref:HYC_CC_PP family protein n=1 Tax=Xanthomarina sp. F2636L TaxID=2996018 RepID=UPI00225E463A|nr:hypothetical protein [Xanthomarina sp. F2636L]MCX7551815.1 hypothetical protein [Xanthomarina sp. F2636L]